MMDDEPKTIRCTDCYSEFSESELQNVACCPTCGNTGVPCTITDDVTIKINWHELRILAMWADNYAQSFTGPAEASKQIVAKIIQRLEAQHPDKTPLTLAGEIRQLQEEYPGMSLLRGEKVIVPPKKVQ